MDWVVAGWLVRVGRGLLEWPEPESRWLNQGPWADCDRKGGWSVASPFLGEFEQMVLLAVLQGGENANAVAVRRELEVSANRSVSRGAFYTTLDRLEKKGHLIWESRVPSDGRREAPERHFTVTKQGIQALRKSRSALMKLWRNLDGVLEV